MIVIQRFLSWGKTEGEYKNILLFLISFNGGIFWRFSPSISWNIHGKSILARESRLLMGFFKRVLSYISQKEVDQSLECFYTSFRDHCLNFVWNTETHIWSLSSRSIACELFQLKKEKEREKSFEECFPLNFYKFLVLRWTIKHGS